MIRFTYIHQLDCGKGRDVVSTDSHWPDRLEGGDLRDNPG